MSHWESQSPTYLFPSFIVSPQLISRPIGLLETNTSQIHQSLSYLVYYQPNTSDDMLYTNLPTNLGAISLGHWLSDRLE
jgi:hypothetical protein